MSERVAVRVAEEQKVCVAWNDAGEWEEELCGGDGSGACDQCRVEWVESESFLAPGELSRLLRERVAARFEEARRGMLTREEERMFNCHPGDGAWLRALGVEPASGVQEGTNDR